MTIEPGTYKTRDGADASVWDWGRNLLGEECWRGTIRGQGFCAWDAEGRDLAGQTGSDLVARRAVAVR